MVLKTQNNKSINSTCFIEFLDFSFYLNGCFLIFQYQFPLKNSKNIFLCLTAKKASSKAFKKRPFETRTSSTDVGKKFIAETFNKVRFKLILRTIVNFFTRSSKVSQVFKAKKNFFFKGNLSSKFHLNGVLFFLLQFHPKFSLIDFQGVLSADPNSSNLFFS